MLSNTIFALSLLPVSLAHFTLNWPESRGSDESTAENFPCGGYSDVGERTDFPINGGPLQLEMGHDQTNVAVYMAIGSDPGTAFNIVVRPQFVVTGLGPFCIGELNVPMSANVSDGTQATIQVVSNAHGGGGLYQCTDVTLRSSPLSDYNDHCSNNTGITISQENMSGNPNGTETANESPSGTAPAAPSDTTGAASHVKAASWALGAVGAAGLALL